MGKAKVIDWTPVQGMEKRLSKLPLGCANLARMYGIEANVRVHENDDQAVAGPFNRCQTWPRQPYRQHARQEMYLKCVHVCMWQGEGGLAQDQQCLARTPAALTSAVFATLSTLSMSGHSYERPSSTPNRQAFRMLSAKNATEHYSRCGGPGGRTATNGDQGAANLQLKSVPAPPVAVIGRSWEEQQGLDVLPAPAERPPRCLDGCSASAGGHITL